MVNSCIDCFVYEIYSKTIKFADSDKSEVYIPNEEIKREYRIAVENAGWDTVVAAGAIAQIKQKHYIKALEEYKGSLLLVGINYDRKSKSMSAGLRN